MSVRIPALASPVTSSGARYSGVPITVPFCVGPVGASMSRAMPKSIILI